MLLVKILSLKPQNLHLYFLININLWKKTIFLLTDFIYIEKNSAILQKLYYPFPWHLMKETLLLKVESWIFKNAFNYLHGYCSVSYKFNRCFQNVVIKILCLYARTAVRLNIYIAL